MRSRIDWLELRRTRQLLAAAANDDLFYRDGTLCHRVRGLKGGDIAATAGDTALVADLITAGRLRRDESGHLAVVETVGAS